MRHEIGERVGAILGSKNSVIEFLGYGIYEGDFDPDHESEGNPMAIGAIAEMGRRTWRTNPRIKLDNGKIVWGCECWWGSENKIKQQLELAKASGQSIKEVDIDNIRNSFKESEPRNQQR